MQFILENSVKRVCITIRARGTKKTATVWGYKSNLFRGLIYGIEILHRDWRHSLSAISVYARTPKGVSDEVVVQYVGNERPRDISCVVVMPVNTSGVSFSAVRLEIDCL